MNAKINDLDNEKNSLITVIKILQEDQHKENQWSTQTRQKKDTKQLTPPTYTSNNDQLRTSNRYSILSDTSSEDEIVTTSHPTQPQDGNSTIQRRSQTHNPTKQPEKLCDDGKRTNSSNLIGGTQSVNTQSKRTGRNRQDSKFSQSRVVILGDSMLKHLDTKRMQNGLINQKVNIKTFPGDGIDQMKHCFIPTLNTNPDNIIMHIGTNNLHNITITDLGETIVQQNCGISLPWSEIITRKEDQNLANKLNVQLNYVQNISGAL